MDDLQDIEEIYKKSLNDLKSAYDRKMKYSITYKNNALDNFQRALSIRLALKEATLTGKL